MSIKRPKAKFFYLIFFVAISTIASEQVLAQVDTTAANGQVLSGEVVIEKEKKITLPQLDKIYRRTEQTDFATGPLNLTFNTTEPSFEWPPYKSDVPYEAVEGDYPLAVYQNYVKLGYGNFASPLFEAGFHRILGAFETSARLYYEAFKTGPVNGENSGSNRSGLEVATTYQNDFWTISPFITFHQQGYQFYGNADRINTGFPSETTGEVDYNHFTIGSQIGGEEEGISFSLKPFFDYTNQLLQQDEANKESVFALLGSFDYRIAKQVQSGISLDLYTSKYNGGTAYGRSLVTVRPWIRYQKEALTLSGGFTLASSTTLASESGFYPFLKAEWELSDTWSVFGAVDGGIEWVGLQSLLETNEFLDDSLSISNQETLSSVELGLKGAVGSHTGMGASVSYSTIGHLPFFVVSPNDNARYTVTYDDSAVGRFTFQSFFTYTPTSTSTYSLDVELSSYTMDTLDRPWHMPLYQFTVATSHNINEKLLASLDLTYMGGIEAPADAQFGLTMLDPFMNVNIGTTYLLSDRASLFVDVENLLNKEYERFLGYPVRGLTFKIGGQYRF